ncbi:TolC family protein [Prevotella cerevisiae]|uniref:TolC family protein n=1 Tax=Segatella cerevisiae TaxID=2053716 RepID=A0ABT1BV02_9BACT|nr:TolC family protein [Segatella cerevisiae]MCO6024916.1 TolC family protein [Segatella cerevisiae]
MKRFTFILFLLASVTHVTIAQQQISLQEAFKKALATYPTLRSSHLNTSSRKALEGTAWDIGSTEMSSGAEEMGKGNDGIRTLIAVRQNLDIFNIGVRRQMLRQQTRVSEAETQFLERNLIREVGIDYASAFVARLKIEKLRGLDSVYSDFERAAKLRYTTEATSRLEYLAAQNQARQIKVTLKQAQYDLLMANQNLSRWLSADTLYTPDDKMMLSEQERLLDLSSTTHPILGLAEEKARLADAGIKEARSAYLPKLFAEFGSQKIGSVNGYYSWQVGLSIPLVFGATKSRVRSAKIERERSQADYDDVRRRYSFSIKELQAELAKWEQSVTYYRQTALPMAQKQKEKALLTYKEQETNYLEFIQNMHDAVQIEMGYLDAYAKYLNTKLNLEYYQ